MRKPVAVLALLALLGSAIAFKEHDFKVGSWAAQLDRSRKLCVV